MITWKRKEGKAWRCLTGGWKIGRMEKVFPPSNLPAFHLASLHIKFTLEIGVYAHSYVNTSKPLGFGVGFFPAKSLTDFHVQSEWYPAK